MNRRGFAIVGEQLVRLLYGAIILIAVIGIGVAIVYLLLPKNSNFSAEQNLKAVKDRIAVAQQNGEQAFSVVIGLPKETALIGFSKGQQQLENKKATVIASETPLIVGVPPFKLDRPSSCGNNACLCVMDTEHSTILTCTSIDAETVSEKDGPLVVAGTTVLKFTRSAGALQLATTA